MNSSDEKPRLLHRLSLLGLLSSALLIAAGNLWSIFSKPEHVWSQEQAEEYVAASAEYHNATTGHNHGKDGKHGEDGNHATRTPEVDRAEARQRFDRISQELEAAQYAKHRGGGLLSRIGMVALACSGAMYFMTRNT